MVNWSIKETLKVFALWINALGCLAQLVGFIVTIILLKKFRNDDFMCKDSFFAYDSSNNSNNATRDNCALTTEGFHIVVSYFVLSALGSIALLCVYFHSVILPWLTEKVNMPTVCGWIVFILPIIPAHLITTFSVIVHLFYPRIFLTSDLVVTFHRSWMGYASTAFLSWLTIFVQTIFMVQSGLELTVASGVIMSKYANHFSRFYFSFAIIHALVRVTIFGIRFLQAIVEYVLCDCLGICFEDVRLKYFNKLKNTSTNMPTDTDNIMDHQT